MGYLLLNVWSMYHIGRKIMKLMLHYIKRHT